MNATADSSEKAALKPFPFRPIHPGLKTALAELAQDEDLPLYFGRARNDIINLILEEKLRSLGKLGRHRPKPVGDE